MGLSNRQNERQGSLRGVFNRKLCIVYSRAKAPELYILAAFIKKSMGDL